MKRSIIAPSALFASIFLALFVSTNIDQRSFMTLGQLTDDPFADEFDSNDLFDDFDNNTASGTIIPSEQIAPVIPEQNIEQPSTPAPIFYRNGKEVQVSLPQIPEPEDEIIPVTPPDTIEPTNSQNSETGSGEDVLPLPEDPIPPANNEPSEDTQPSETVHYAAAIKGLPIIPIAIGAIAVILTFLVVLWLINRKKNHTDKSINEEDIGPHNPQIASDRLKQALSTLEANESEKEIPSNNKMPEVVTPADVINEKTPTTQNPPEQTPPPPEEPPKAA